MDAGDPIGFTITVANGGPGTAKGVTLSDPLPAGTTAAGWTIASGPTQCSISGAVGSQTLSCSAVDLAAGGSYSVHVTAATSFADCTSYDNTATASASNAPDATDSASITCQKPSLSLTKTADATTVNAGDPIGFTITVANGGPGTAKGVTLSDPLPARYDGCRLVEGFRPGRVLDHGCRGQPDAVLQRGRSGRGRQLQRARHRCDVVRRLHEVRQHGDCQRGERAGSVGLGQRHL